jgi:hypothetical protein
MRMAEKIFAGTGHSFCLPAMQGTSIRPWTDCMGPSLAFAFYDFRPFHLEVKTFCGGVPCLHLSYSFINKRKETIKCHSLTKAEAL